MPWNWRRQFFPCTSSHLRRILRYAWSSSLFRSPSEISKTRPLRPSEAIFVPCVRVTIVLPQLRTENMEGALRSYQSFFWNGSIAFFFFLGLGTSAAGASADASGAAATTASSSTFFAFFFFLGLGTSAAGASADASGAAATTASSSTFFAFFFFLFLHLHL